MQGAAGIIGYLRHFSSPSSAIQIPIPKFQATNSIQSPNSNHQRYVSIESWSLRHWALFGYKAPLPSLLRDVENLFDLFSSPKRGRKKLDLADTKHLPTHTRIFKEIPCL